MRLALVTLKLKREPTHNPQHKQTAACRWHSNGLCTDSTGEHHTIAIVPSDRFTDEEIVATINNSDMARIFHITRVEMTELIGLGDSI